MGLGSYGAGPHKIPGWYHSPSQMLRQSVGMRPVWPEELCCLGGITQRGNRRVHTGITLSSTHCTTLWGFLGGGGAFFFSDSVY